MNKMRLPHGKTGKRLIALLLAALLLLPVLPVVPAGADVPAGTEWIVDEKTAVFTGNWADATDLTRAELYGDSASYGWGGTGTTAAFTFTAEADGWYNIYAWWGCLTNGASDAPFTVTCGSQSAVVRMNQLSAGGQWNRLASVKAEKGEEIVVSLSADADSYVVADAIRLTLDEGIILDDGEAVYTGDWTEEVEPANPARYGGGFRYHFTDAASSATYTATAEEAGTYIVYAWWTALSNRATNAPFTLSADGGEGEIFRLNQQENGGQWNRIGEVEAAAGGTITVTLSADADNFVIADAIKLVKKETAVEESDIVMTDLKVCNMDLPLGIDENPVFSWVLTGRGRDEGQTAYRVVVSSTYEQAAAGTGDVWDSGRVESGSSIDIAYAGEALASKTSYYWTATSWDREDRVVTSGVQRFSTGLLSPDEWAGEWIGKEKPTYTMEMTGARWIWRAGSGTFGGVPAGTQYFRKSFTPAADKTVRQILVGFTADDSATLYFNGQEFGPVTSWSTGLLVDVTHYASEGENTVAIAANNATAGYAGMLAKVIVSYTDGSADTYVSDKSWKVSSTGTAGWDAAGFDDSGWASPDQAVDFGADPWGSGLALEYSGARAAVLLRKEFSVEKEVKEAFAYICGLGFFELTVNGKLPDDSLLNPYITQYNKTVLYRTFDVTSLLQSGENAVGVELGNAYYNEIGGVWNWQTASWRDDPKLLMNLEIHYTDGTKETLSTDTSWTVTDEGPTVSNSMYYGETYDARREQTGFSSPGFDDAAWQAAAPAAAPEGELRAQMKAPIKRVASFAPAKIERLANGSYLVTAPEMAAGWMKLSGINEAAGRKITITYGQALNEDGTVVKWGGADGKTNHWWPHAYIQQDNYIAKGAGNESFEPKFSYKGHQYIQIDGLTSEPKAEDITIYRVSNAVDQISEFSSSNEMLNELHQMMQRAMANNFQGEHCDPVLEKCGWLGDANVSLGSLMYSYDMAATLPGWLAVMEDCFEQYGTVTVTAPTADWWIDNTPVWNTLFVYGVEDLERYFGTAGYAADQYDVLRRYTQMQIAELEKNGWVWGDGGLGDWVAPIGGSDPNAAYNENISEGAGITATSLLYGVLKYMAALADRLGQTDDAAEYRAAMEKVYAAFNAKFYKPEAGIYQTDYWTQIGTRTRYRQTDNLVALRFGLVPEENVRTVVDNLVADIREKDYHLDTGCVGTRYILPVLCDYGYSDIAYRIVTQTTYPSWGYWLENGATSTWEMWEATTRSYDHYFLGTYDEWFYSHLAGVTDIADGYRSFSVKPGIMGDLTSAGTAIDTPRGRLESGWTLGTAGEAELRVTVPFGSTAQIWLPTGNTSGVLLDGEVVSEAADGVKTVETVDGQVVITVGSGSYVFQSPTDRISVYKESLRSALAQAESFDPAALDAATRETYNRAIDGAKATLEDAAATQEAVNEALAVLESLLDLLNGSEARQALREQIAGAQAEPILETHYPSGALESYHTTLTAAKQAAGDYTAADAALVAAGEALKNALSDLLAAKYENLAVGKTAAASSTHDDDYWGWNLSFLNDGLVKHDSRQQGEYVGYSSETTPDVDHAEWVSIDLGKVCTVNNVVFYPASSRVDGKMLGYGCPIDFKIQLSTDGKTWETVREEHDYPLPEYGPLSFSFDGREARYVRLYADSLRPKGTDANSYRLQLCELEVYSLPQTGEKCVLASDRYTVSDDGYISGVDAATRVEDFLASLGCACGKLAVYDAAGETVTSGRIGTGMVLRHEGGEISAYTIAVTGDLDGDGGVTVSDVVALRGRIVQGNSAKYELLAGDLDPSGSLTVSDVVALRSLIVRGAA